MVAAWRRGTSVARVVGVSTLEWIAAALGMACVAFVVRRSLWNYPFAILSVTLLGFVLWDAKLYSGALLQGFFVVINLYGWWSWHRSRAAHGEVLIERLTPVMQVGALSGMIGLTLGWGAIMASQTDAARPYIDAAVAMLSVGAQILQASRRLESWFVWIVVDLIAIPLYAAQGLYVAAGLYVIYLGMSVWGLLDWRHRLLRSEGPLAA